VVKHDSPKADISGSFILHMQMPGIFWNYRPDLLATQQPRSPAHTGRARNLPRLLSVPGLWMSCGRAT
jgi:hypothetical protein